MLGIGVEPDVPSAAETIEAPDFVPSPETHRRLPSSVLTEVTRPPSKAPPSLVVSSTEPSAAIFATTRGTAVADVDATAGVPTGAL